MKSVCFLKTVNLALVCLAAVAAASPRIAAAASPHPSDLIEQKLLAADGTPYDGFGHAVAVNGDFAFLAAPNNPSQNGTGPAYGAVYVWHRIDGVWQFEQKLQADDRAAADTFGTRIALQGTTALIAAPYVQIGQWSQAGAVYVFRYDGSTWTQAQKLTSDVPALVETFGDSVALDGSTAVVGASGARGPNNEEFVGAAYVFKESGGVWSPDQKLTVADFARRDLFGISVGVGGDVILVGASQATWMDDGPGPGRVHVFEPDQGGTWAETSVLHASDGVRGDYFGAALAFDGVHALIGAPASMIEDRAYQGAAYAYTRAADGSWIDQGKLYAAEGGEMGVFGRAIALSGNRALIGAPGDVGFAGAAYLFSWGDDGWTESQSLVASDGVVGDYLGWDVAVGPDSAFVGAPHELDDGLDSPGAVYLYTTPVVDAIFADGFDATAP